MKKRKLVLTVVAFLFAIAGALASKNIVLAPYEEGAPTGDCPNAVDLDQTCYSPGTGNQCFIGVNEAWVEDTDCSQGLFESPM